MQFCSINILIQNKKKISIVCKRSGEIKKLGGEAKKEGNAPSDINQSLLLFIFLGFELCAIERNYFNVRSILHAKSGNSKRGLGAGEGDQGRGEMERP